MISASGAAAVAERIAAGSSRETVCDARGVPASRSITFIDLERTMNNENTPAHRQWTDHERDHSLLGGPCKWKAPVGTN
jgi:hypothetical protein